VTLGTVLVQDLAEGVGQAARLGVDEEQLLLDADLANRCHASILPTRHARLGCGG
jgi:hypothetical protein